MQTLTRYSRPRNVATYRINARPGRLANRWDALNTAEYWIWRACRLSIGYLTLSQKQEREECKASARFFLNIARTL